MSPNRITFDQMKKQLREGRYSSFGVATRSMKKAVTLSDEERQEFTQLAARRFGVTQEHNEELDAQADALQEEGLLRPAGEPSVLEKYKKLLRLKRRIELSRYIEVNPHALMRFVAGSKSISKELRQIVSDGIEKAYEQLVRGKTAAPKVTKKPVVQVTEQKPSIIQNVVDLDAMELDLLNRKQAIIDRMRAAGCAPRTLNGVAKV